MCKVHVFGCKSLKAHTSNKGVCEIKTTIRVQCNDASCLTWPDLVHIKNGHLSVYSPIWTLATISSITPARVKSLDTYQSKWLLLWAEAFCLRQPGLQGKETHTHTYAHSYKISFNCLLLCMK